MCSKTIAGSEMITARDVRWRVVGICEAGKYIQSRKLALSILNLATSINCSHTFIDQYIQFKSYTLAMGLI